MEFEERFSTEEGCRDYLFALRWPRGFRCPRCACAEFWVLRSVRYQCVGCGHQSSLTSGTIFQGTHLPLRIWFRAMWWVSSQKNGASALGLKRVLGCSYKTAWMLLHKFRRAMVRPGRDRLSGHVELDETYLGSLEEGLRGRQTARKAIVAVAAQRKGKHIGRIRMKRIPNVSSKSLVGFVEESVEPGSTVHTDGWDAYTRLGSKGYDHRSVVMARQRSGSASDSLQRVHRVVSLLKRWLMGTHQGAVSHEHLDYYLDEFVFRFNRRSSQYRGKLFYRLVQQAAQTSPVPWDDIKQDVRGLRNGKHYR